MSGICGIDPSRRSGRGATTDGSLAFKRQDHRVPYSLRRGATADGSRGFQPTVMVEKYSFRRGATVDPVAPHGVAHGFHASLRDADDRGIHGPWVKTRGYHHAVAPRRRGDGRRRTGDADGDELGGTWGMSWIRSTLGEIVADKRGLVQTGPFGSQLHQSDYTDEGTPLIMPTNISDGRVSIDGIARVSEETADRMVRHKLKPRTIVLPRRGEITKRAFIREDQEDWLCGSGCLKIEVHDTEVIPEFLYYFMATHETGQWLEKHAVGSTMLNLSAGIVNEMPVIFPAKKVQKRIAEILTAYDDLIENNRRRMALLEESARLLYREWFVRLRFPGHEHTRIVNGVPEGWRKVTLGELATKIGSGVTPRGGDASYLTEGVPLIRSMNIYDDHFDADGLAFINDDQAARMSSVTVQSRDILINITGTSVAPCCMAPERFVPARVNQHVMIIRVDPAIAAPCFVHAAINSEERKRQLLSYAQKASTREALTKETLSTFEITLPSPELVAHFGEIAECSFLQRETLAQQNQKLRTARDLLLPKLMSGEIEV
jgi:type I restriction enzyme S subunit